MDAPKKADDKGDGKKDEKELLDGCVSTCDVCNGPCEKSDGHGGSHQCAQGHEWG